MRFHDILLLIGTAVIIWGCYELNTGVGMIVSGAFVVLYALISRPTEDEDTEDK